MKTELNESAVMPIGSRHGLTTVMIVIPVAQQPNAALNSSESTRASQVARGGTLRTGG